MPTLRISARAERVDRERTHARSKLDNTYIRSTGNSIPALLSADRRRVKCKDRAIITIHAADGEAQPGVLELFVLAFVETLEARNSVAMIAAT
jgi:hypothetical protein